jgi:hypothetical protein
MILDEVAAHLRPRWDGEDGEQNQSDYDDRSRNPKEQQIAESVTSASSHD